MSIIPICLRPGWVRGQVGDCQLQAYEWHVEPGAKPFVDDLLLGRGFVRSRAAPSLRSIESQPSTQGFVSAGRAGTRRPPAPARTRASGGVVGGASLSLPPPTTYASPPSPDDGV